MKRIKSVIKPIEQALAAARALDADNDAGLYFTNYDDGQPVNQIDIYGPHKRKPSLLRVGRTTLWRALKA